MPFGAKIGVVSSSSISELGTVMSIISSAVGLHFLGRDGDLRAAGLLGDMGLHEGPATLPSASRLELFSGLLFRFLDIPLSVACGVVARSISRLTSPKIKGLYGTRGMSAEQPGIVTKTDLASFHDDITFSRTGFGRICASPADLRQLGHSCLLAREILMHCRKRMDKNGFVNSLADEKQERVLQSRNNGRKRWSQGRHIVLRIYHSETLHPEHVVLVQ